MTSLTVEVNNLREYEEESFISGGGGAHPLHPPPRSAPEALRGCFRKAEIEVGEL